MKKIFLPVCAVALASVAMFPATMTSACYGSDGSSQLKGGIPTNCSEVVVVPHEGYSETHSEGYSEGYVEGGYSESHSEGYSETHSEGTSYSYGEARECGTFHDKDASSSSYAYSDSYDCAEAIETAE